MYCDNPGMALNGRVQYYPPAMTQRNGQRPSPDYDLAEYPEQAVLEYSCDEGYQLQGRSSIVCQSTGFWSGDIPQCVPGNAISKAYKLLPVHPKLIKTRSTVFS